MELKIKTDEITAKSILNMLEAYKSVHRGVKIEVEKVKEKKEVKK